MRTKGAFALISAGIGATAVLVAAPAGAQELLPITVEAIGPSGPPFFGMNVTVSGEGCMNENGPGEVEVYLFFEDDDEPVVRPVHEVLADGSWSLVLGVASADPPATFTFSATCFVPDSDEVIAEYDFVEFELTGPPTTTSTTPTTTSTTPPPTASPTPPEASPAVPVIEEPNFTG